MVLQTVIINLFRFFAYLYRIYIDINANIHRYIRTNECSLK